MGYNVYNLNGQKSLLHAYVFMDVFDKRIVSCGVWFYVMFQILLTLSVFRLTGRRVVWARK